MSRDLLCKCGGIKVHFGDACVGKGGKENGGCPNGEAEGRKGKKARVPSTSLSGFDKIFVRKGN